MKKSRAGKSAASIYHKFILNNMPEEGELLLIYVADKVFANRGFCHVGKYNGREVQYETEYGVYTLPMKDYPTSRWAYLYCPDR